MEQNKINMLKINLLKEVRTIEDFPIKGILFYDITTLFKKPECLLELKKEMRDLYKDKGITKVAGIESRGFIMGPILASEIGAGFVPIRKPGKLPAKTLEESYKKEYGIDTIQIHEDAIEQNDVVLIHDDLLATGGTMKAACDLIKKAHPKRIYINTIIELQNLGARKFIDKNIDITSIIKV